MGTGKLAKSNVIDNIYGINSPNGLRYVNGNREVKTASHVNEIEKAMENGDYITPILVDSETLYIIDGQHRFAAASNLWSKGKSYTLQVIFTHFENPLLAAIKYNSKSLRWTIDNYVDAYITEGKESYILLKQFCQSHKLLVVGSRLQYKAAIKLLLGKDCSKFTDGGFFISENNIIAAEETYSQLEKLVLAVGKEKGGYWIIKRDNIQAWIKIREYVLSKMTIDEFAKKMKKNFTLPVANKTELYINEYLRILEK